MTLFNRQISLLPALAMSVLMVGCAGTAPNYSPSVDNVELLKKGNLETIRVGQVAVTQGMPGASSLGIRASSISSPVGANYGDYLARALSQELELAKLQNLKSNIEVTGTLLKNNIYAGGFSTNAGQMEARFVVKRADEVKFDKVKKAELKWDSSFAGAVAIPLAVNNYVVIVQKLLNSLFSDADFVAATKK